MSANDCLSSVKSRDVSADREVEGVLDGFGKEHILVSPRYHGAEDAALSSRNYGILPGGAEAVQVQIPPFAVRRLAGRLVH